MVKKYFLKTKPEFVFKLRGLSGGIKMNQKNPASLMMNNLIVDSINFDKNNKFIFLVATSINDLEWSEIHPEHLKIILEGFTKYEDGILMKPLILEIFKSYKIL